MLGNENVKRGFVTNL